MSREARVTGIWLVAGLAIVFAVDSAFPLGVASGMLYVPLLLVCQPAHGRRWLLPVTMHRRFRVQAAHDEAVERAAILVERRVLGGLLPICAACKRIQRSDAAWQSLEAYIQAHSEASFSHGLCPSCLLSLYPERPSVQ